MSTMRRWAEHKYQRRRGIYMVASFHTVTDARVIESSISGEATGGQVKPPISLSLAVAGVIVLLGDIIDPGIGRDHHDKSLALSQFIARRERMYAVQYRKASHEWLLSKDLDKSRLSKAPRWSCVEGSWAEVEGEDDTIEVKLTQV